MQSLALVLTTQNTKKYTKNGNTGEWPQVSKTHKIHSRPLTKLKSLAVPSS